MTHPMHGGLVRAGSFVTIVVLVAGALGFPAASGAETALHYNGCPIVRKAARIAAADLHHSGIDRYGFATARKFRVVWSCSLDRGVAYGALTVLNVRAPRLSFGRLPLTVCRDGEAVTMDPGRSIGGFNPTFNDWVAPLVPGSESLEHIMIKGLPHYVHLGKCRPR